MQKAIQNALAQQKTENQILVKKVTELESQMAKQTQVPAPQTVEPVRQPRGPPSSLQTEEGMKNYCLSQYLNNLGIFSAEDLERNYPIKPFQRSCPQRSNVSARIDRVEEGIYIRKCDICEETGHSKKNCPNRQIARSNFNRSAYFKPLTPINFQNTSPGSDNEEDGYDKEKINGPFFTTDLENVLARKALEESKKSDEWFSSLQYLHCNINDLTIPDSFLDTRSEFGAMNDLAIYTLGWKIDEPSDFAIKGNSKHFTDSLEYEPEPMLFLGMSNIRKLQGTPEPNKNQFRIKLHRKTYVIPTYSKAPVAKDPPKDKQDQVSTNSSSLTSEIDKLDELKAKVDELKQERDNLNSKNHELETKVEQKDFEIIFLNAKVNELEKVAKEVLCNYGLISCLRSRIRELKDKLEQITPKSYLSSTDSKASGDAVEEVSSFSKTSSFSSHHSKLELDKSKVKDMMESLIEHTNQKLKEKLDSIPTIPIVTLGP
ncbi:hypothetical protein F8M41_018102 [Gigaspora margarita]|uniref:CCHC-type domain-containing protein n=1 Tax=Gigaspora margarita TaxID=4874 RepID=A0A8H4EU94_GIGMA|nr:hypothetical protein F8M41_018102 [Gigaspora margarita]